MKKIKVYGSKKWRYLDRLVDQNDISIEFFKIEDLIDQPKKSYYSKNSLFLVAFPDIIETKVREFHNKLEVQGGQIATIFENQKNRANDILKDLNPQSIEDSLADLSEGLMSLFQIPCFEMNSENLMEFDLDKNSKLIVYNDFCKPKKLYRSINRNLTDLDFIQFHFALELVKKHGVVPEIMHYRFEQNMLTNVLNSKGIKTLYHKSTLSLISKKWGWHKNLEEYSLDWQQEFVGNLNSMTLVFTMGKTGSSTISRTLEESANNISCKSLHLLNPEKIRKAISVAKEQGNYLSYNNFLPHYALSKSLNSLLNSGMIKIITAVRDPIETALSQFFQTIYTTDLVDESGNIDFARTKDAINRKYASISGFEYQLNWFENHFNKALSIDFKDYPYPKNKGYQIIEIDNVQILVLKLECFDDWLEPALEDFYGKNYFQITNTNMSEGKFYDDMYKKIKNEIILSPGLIEEIYNHSYCLHFYTDYELNTFKNRWTQ